MERRALLLDRALDQAADHVELSLEGGLVEAFGRADKELLDRRHSAAGDLTDLRRIRRHFAPPKEALTFGRHSLLDSLDLLRALVAIDGQEYDRGGIASQRGEPKAFGVSDLSQELVRRLDQHARAVTGRFV